MSTMNAGFQMVAVQNQHYVNAPEQDGNLVIGAVTAGTDLSGEVAPTRFSNPVRPDGQAGSFSTSNPNDQAKGISTASASLGALGSEGVNKNPESTTKKSNTQFASEKFGMDSGSARTVGTASTGGGPSWFDGSKVTGEQGATPGSGSGGAEFEGGQNRRIASTDTLAVNDPENYFLMSDVGVSLFKRVSAQCRKKERSLVLAPMPGEAN
jgi:hypothetical protein